MANYPVLIKQMHSGEWYGRIIYSLTLEELESNWTQAKLRGFGDEFHETYYKLALKRIRETPVNVVSPANTILKHNAAVMRGTIQQFQSSVVQYKSQKITKSWKFKHNSKKRT
jgi:hypothetical protein